MGVSLPDPGYSAIDPNRDSSSGSPIGRSTVKYLTVIGFG